MHLAISILVLSCSVDAKLNSQNFMSTWLKSVGYEKIGNKQAANSMSKVLAWDINAEREQLMQHGAAPQAKSVQVTEGKNSASHQEHQRKAPKSILLKGKASKDEHDPNEQDKASSALHLPPKVQALPPAAKANAVAALYKAATAANAAKETPTRKKITVKKPPAPKNFKEVPKPDLEKVKAAAVKDQPKAAISLSHQAQKVATNKATSGEFHQKSEMILDSLAIDL